MTHALQNLLLLSVHSTHYGKFKTGTCRAPPMWRLKKRCLVAGIAQHTRPVLPMLHYPARSSREEGSAASTEASKAHGCGHVWIQAVFVLIIFLRFSLHAAQSFYKMMMLGAVSTQRADGQQRWQCRELSDCHRRLQCPGSQSQTLHVSFLPVASLCPKRAVLSSDLQFNTSALAAWASSRTKTSVPGS